MDIGNIIKNSLGYPLSNVKNFLILGLIILLAELYSILSSVGIKNGFLVLLMIFAFLLMILREGYKLRILGSSIDGSDVLPDFGNWKRMFLDGVNILIVTIIYMIPLIIILFLGIMGMGMFLFSSGASEGSFGRMLLTIIMAIAGIYLIIIYPLLLMAFANMAHNKSSISHGLKFGEIKTKISHIGLGSFVGWYIATGIIFVILLSIGTLLSTGFRLIDLKVVGMIINALFIAPFSVIFLMRSTSLVYRYALKVQEEFESGEYPEETV